MRKKDKITVSFVAIILVGIIGMWGLDFSSQYLTVTEVKENAAGYINQSVEITGKVKQDTLVFVDNDQTNFILTDGISEIEVNHRGDRPPQLAEGAKVSVKGVLVSENKVNANFLVLGCPSKYGV